MRVDLKIGERFYLRIIVLIFPPNSYPHSPIVMQKTGRMRSCSYLSAHNPLSSMLFYARNNCNSKSYRKDLLLSSYFKSKYFRVCDAYFLMFSVSSLMGELMLLSSAKATLCPTIAVIYDPISLW